MNKKERERKVILSGYEERRYTLSEAAIRMEISYRQAKRIWKRYKKHGDLGLLHKNRGHKFNIAFNISERNEILKLYKEKYDRFSATFAEVVY